MSRPWGGYTTADIKEASCPRCGSEEIVEADELRCGYNGAASDEGTGLCVLACLVCGEVVDS